MAIDAGHPGSILQKLLYGRISHSEVAKLLVLLLSALAILPHQSYPQRPDLPFEEISLGEGIPTFVQCILQDRTGYLWFATWSGLYKYDGYTFVSHRHDPDDSSSIIDNTLSRLYEDRAGVLWIGSWHGLEKFNRMTGTFSHYTPNPLGTGEDGSNNVWAICEDNNGVLWVGTGWGLKQLNRATGKFTSLRYDTTDPGSIFHNSVGAIYEDREGSLWFATGGGLDRFDFRTGKFIHYWNDPSNRHKSWDNTSEYWINSLCGDDTGILWLGTNGGLVEFNPRESTFSTYRFDQKAPQNRITSICQDVITGSLWVATSDGLLSFDRESKAFTHHDLKANYVYSERSGTLWVGTDAGTKKLNRTKQPFTKYPSKDMIYAVCNGNEGRLWIYTFDGWKQFDTRKEQFVPYSFGKDYLFYVWNFGSDLSIRTKEGGIYIQDSLGSTRCSMDSSWKNYLDAASFGWKGKKGYWGGFASGDLDLWEPKTNRVLKIKNFKQPIYWIYEETCGLLWIATYMDKLFCYDYVRDSTIEFLSDTQNPSSISGRQISQIYEDKKGRLWFATNSGLNRYRRSTNSFVHFTERNGLPSNNVRGILEDDHGFLWLNTGKGISKFDPETNQFKNYDVSYGVEPAADLYYGVGCRTRNGEMYFGGAKGFARFHPDSVKDNPFIPPIVVTSFKKFDKPFPVSSEIGLAYDENFISFEFAALSYMSPERNQYAYKMEGLDKDWVYSGTRRYASYPGLEPGEYVFRVKGSNNDGVWNEAGTSIAILISPPWWKNRWAYGLYALALVGAIYGAWRMQMRRVRVRHEYEMSRFEAAKLREVDELKSRFFANISHEFRTPLTLILGPVKRMRDASQDQQTRDDLGLVHKNATRLLELVNQLLDLSRLESGAVKLQAAPENIVPLLKGLLQSFCSYAERKRISMAFTSSAEDIVVYIDREKLQKIITNILANAFKFTPEGGRIEVSVAHDSQYVSVRISDTGIGIPAGKIPLIFDRFYQVDGSHTREQEGTGIGLSLTRELVELHKGTIAVESEEGRGSTFTVRLPLGKTHLKPEEICEPEEVVKREEDRAMPLPALLSEQEGTRPGGIPSHILKESAKPVLLIVEDNADVRQYIRRDLDEEYNILEAVDGADGWEKSVNQMPDIIVSDVMMPKLDGFALCAKLKGDERTCHIPVVLLTAKASSQDKIEGFEIGADDYIMKPFEPAELRVRLRNLLDQRARLHEYFRKHGLFEIEEQKITPVDQKFLQNAVASITEHMSDPAFGVESLAAEMAVSRSLLLKKIEALTGEMPSELIKRTRLNKAAKLVENRFGNVTEVAFEVGFSNPAYFAECFKKQFGCPPSHYHRSSAQQ